MAVLMTIGIAGTLLAEEPATHARPHTMVEAVYLPFVDFVKRLGWRGTAIVLGFVAVYKFGDFFAQALLVAFLKQGAGFEFTEIALVYKVLGFAGIFIGGFAGGSLVARFGLARCLIAFGIAQAATNLLYAWLAQAGTSFPIFCTAVLIDNITGAMGVAAFLSMQMEVCSPTVSATQFALLTSLTSVGQRVFGPLADDLVAHVGWSGFFVCTSLMAIPGLLLVGAVARRGRLAGAR
jgi:MFS transporter, PAT family, beta-lactamase induction signal transducer AmpG